MELYTVATQSPKINCKEGSALINAFKAMNLSRDSKTGTKSPSRSKPTQLAPDLTSTTRPRTPGSNSNVPHNCQEVNLSSDACKMPAASNDGEESKNLPKSLVAKQQLAMPSRDYSKYCDYVYKPSQCTLPPTYSPCELIPADELPEYLSQWQNVLDSADEEPSYASQKVWMERQRELDDYLQKIEEETMHTNFV